MSRGFAYDKVQLVILLKSFDIHEIYYFTKY